MKFIYFVQSEGILLLILQLQGIVLMFQIWKIDISIVTK